MDVLCGKEVRKEKNMFIPFKISKVAIDNACNGYEYDTKDVSDYLSKHINKDTIKQALIDGTKLQEDWFPTWSYDSRFQVFISHAHQDEVTVKRLAGFLKEKCGLNSFIDSEYWGYIGSLQKDLDEYYSKVFSDGRYMYDYQTSSFVAANVHIMLSMALMKMMDACECLMFVDSDNSMKYAKGQTLTPSPWIYEEMGFSRMLRVNIPDRYKKLIRVNLNESRGTSEIRMVTDLSEPRQMHIQYIVNMSDFMILSSHDLKSIENLYGSKALDELYKKYGMVNVLKKLNG